MARRDTKENKKSRFYEFRKSPKMKLKKLQMDDVDQIEDLNGNLAEWYEKEKQLGRTEQYPQTSYASVQELVNFAAENFSDRVFILDKDKPRDREFKEYTYSRFISDVNCLGTALINKHMKQGEPIVIIGENQYDWYVSYITALLGAGIAVPLDKELPEHELENTINRCGASVVIYSPKLKDKFKKFDEEDKLPTVKRFIQMRSEEGPEGRNIGFKRVLLEGDILMGGGNRSFIDIKTDPDEFAALFFTSGTTASSKGVMATSRMLANNINAVSAYVNINEEDRFFSVLPLHHTYESSIGFLLALGYGSSIAVCQGLRYLSDNMKETKPSIIIAVPLLIEHLYNAIMKNIRKSKKEKLVSSLMQTTSALKRNFGVDVRKRAFREIYEGIGGNIRYIVSAAAPLDPEIANWFTDLGVMFLQGYGLTETCPISAVTPEYDTRPGSAGKVIAGGRMRVDDPDENGDGEIVISTNTLMLGYYQDEEATNEVIEVDDEGRRWFHSGDIGHIDEDNFVYITGRIKNVIVTQNGKNIYPEELEQLFTGVDIIDEIMIYGKEVPDSKDLLVTARVLPDYNMIKALYGNVSIEEIYDLIMAEIKAVNKKTTNYKAIKRLELKDEPFIKTTTMKTKRFAEIKEGKVIYAGKEKKQKKADVDNSQN